MTPNEKEMIEQADALIRKEKWDETHKLCLEILEKNPRCAHAYYLIAFINLQHEAGVAAVHDLNRALHIDPENPLYLAHMGQALGHAAMFENALRATDMAAKFVRADADHTNDAIGTAYNKITLYEKAIPFFERAIEAAPDNAYYHYNYASTVQVLGNMEEAEKAYIRAYEINPKLTHAYTSLAHLKKQTEDYNYIDTLKDLYEKRKDHANQSLLIGHALAKSYEDLGNDTLSLDWLFKAKSRQKEKCSYTDEKEDIIFAAAAKTSFYEPSGGFETDEPIFIIGMPRTGTTLVDRIISSHSHVMTAGELTLFPKTVKRHSKSKSDLTLDVETLAAAEHMDYEAAGKFYLDNTRHITGSTKRFTDKLPMNSYYAGLISKVLPNAKIVCLRRHPFDAGMANFRQMFNVNQHYLDYNYDLENVAKHYLRFDDLAAHWRETIPSHQYMEIQYEDIIDDQENQTKALLEFCDLPWEDACIDFHMNKAPVATASINQVRQPLYSSSVDRWKKYGEAIKPMTDIIEAKLGPQG